MLRTAARVHEAPVMRLRHVTTIMAFVDHPAAAARFWADALEAAVDPELPLVELGQVKLFFHAADAHRNPPGGTVVYFAVEDFNRARAALLAAGCSPHRGPIAAADGRRICQIRDPFGTVWGLEES
jgi:predicted enzyme related to lactoylglutathione lyase